tara:strand:- start:105 stop:1337 length:1233 start_codon:yes stop_codon:yes gene_type:complete
MKLTSLINLKPLKEGAFGMSAKDLAATYSLKRLQSIRDEIMGDMEQEAEPEGGRIADMYADQLQGVDDAIAIKRGDSGTPLTYDQAVGRVSRDQFNKSSKFDRINEATEKSWNAIDVSRKAEKEIDNKEWNSRTTKKLDMLKALNKAGKFKKDWGEEKLQGWVDQNYSWEKLSRQFKLNESKNNKMKGKLLTERFQELAGIKPLYEADPEAIKGKHYPDEETVKKLRKGPYASGGQNAHLKEMIKKVVNLKMDSEVGEPVTVEYDPTKNLQDVTISWGNESHTVDFEPGDEIDNHGNEGSDIETIANSDDGRWQFILDVYVGYQFDMTGDYEEWDFDELIVQGHPENEDHLDPEDRFDQDPMEEGSCGYGPDGVPGDTPGETKGMPADTRTMTMMRESIRKEIKRLHENK